MILSRVHWRFGILCCRTWDRSSRHVVVDREQGHPIIGSDGHVNEDPDTTEKENDITDDVIVYVFTYEKIWIVAKFTIPLMTPITTARIHNMSAGIRNVLLFLFIP